MGFYYTLHRIQKPLGESPHFVSLNILFLVKGTKKVSFVKLYTVTVGNVSHTLINCTKLQKSTWFLFTSVYFDSTVF